MSDFAGKLTGAQIDALPEKIESLEAQLGALTDLSTNEKENLVAALNEVAAREGGTAISHVEVTVDNNVGTPSAEASIENGNLTIILKNVKGEPGEGADLTTINEAIDNANTAATAANDAVGSVETAVTEVASAVASATSAAGAATDAAAAASQAAANAEDAVEQVADLLEKQTESIMCSMNINAGMYLTEYITLKAGQTIIVESSFPTKLSALGGEELTSEFATNYTYTVTEDMKVTIWGNQGESTNPADYSSSYSVKTPSEIQQLKDAIEKNAADIEEQGTAIFNLQEGKLDKPSNDGIAGQVLTKTEEGGVEWTDPSTGTGGGGASVDWLSDTTSIILEESADPKWTKGCAANVVENIISEYGSYIIDPVNKKYARLSSADHRKFADGTAWDGTWGEAFRRFPKVYYAIRTNNKQQKVLYLGLTDLGSGSWEETWTGVYKGSVDASGKLHSRPGLTSTQNKTMTAFWEAAQQTGTDMGLVSYLDHCKIGAIHLVKFGNANSSFSMGHGLQDAGNTYYTHTTGYTAALGDGTGEMSYGDTDHKMNKLFGIEGLAGATFEFRPGIRFDGTHAIVYSGNRVSNTAKASDADYVRTFERNIDLFASYTKAMAIGNDFDLVPVEGGGSNATYWCDAAWSQSSGKILFVGGSSYGGNYSGLYGAHSYRPFVYDSPSVGARLAFRGDISQYELVDGAVLCALHA